METILVFIIGPPVALLIATIMYCTAGLLIEVGSAPAALATHLIERIRNK